MQEEVKLLRIKRHGPKGEGRREEEKRRRKKRDINRGRSTLRTRSHPKLLGKDPRKKSTSG